MPHDNSISSARIEERELAFRLLLTHCLDDQVPERLQAALQMFERGELDPAGLLVLRRGPQVIGAVAATVVPGRTGLIWPPRAIDGDDRESNEDCLTVAAVEWLMERGACLAQALLHPEETSLAAPLRRNGFQHVTALWYLTHDRELPVERITAASRVVFEPYSQVDPSEFRAVMELSFSGTLDCPEVTGARNVEEVVLGFQGQGVFDPCSWWLARMGELSVGVVITCAVPSQNAWEICYVGMVPAARRQGLGRELVLKALLEARARGVSQVFLTVDARNEPAWQLYRSMGFEPFDRKEVFLIVLTHRI